MLAELAAANAAFGILKTALSNGKEVYDCSAAAAQFFDNKSAIAKRVADKGKTDLEAFMALEKIKEHEEWLKDYMIYAGRADMHKDWLKFQAECKKNRLDKARKQAAKKQQTLNLLYQFIVIVGISVAIIPVLVYLIMYAIF
jgi:hypothetical protein